MIYLAHLANISGNITLNTPFKYIFSLDCNLWHFLHKFDKINPMCFMTDCLMTTKKFCYKSTLIYFSILETFLRLNDS